MRSLWLLFPALTLAVSGSLAADDRPAMTGEAAVAYLDTKRTGPANWRTTPDRLDYLRDRAECAGACAVSSAFPGSGRASLERDYIDALNLVTYGDMDVKFTGDRFKLKVRF